MLLAAAGGVRPLAGAQATANLAAQAKPQNTAVVPAAITPPPDYVIGTDDILSVVFWREKDLSSDVTVRPDGKITLILLNDIPAGGLTPDQLRIAIEAAAGKYVEDPTVTVQVKQINSRKVYVVGEVAKPGFYPLGGPTTVLQMIASAGGPLEYAKTKDIVVNRTDNGKALSFKVNYNDLERGKNLQQNILLKPGDTIVVP
jgi:polysaccharide export outer membrane protein